jgi:hypothetical protein
MADREKRKGSPTRNRLESWLIRKIQAGGLKSLPRYSPLRGCGGQCPEQYARGLLAGLRTAGDNVRMIDTVKDDGRAFRSWVESALGHAPQGCELWGGQLTQGFAP